MNQKAAQASQLALFIHPSSLILHPFFWASPGRRAHQSLRPRLVVV
jgi:hypothetical protein